MCSAPKMPKPDPAAVAAANKKPQYLRNPWLDSLSINGAGAGSGRNDLVIDPGTRPQANPVAPPPVTTLPNYTGPYQNIGFNSGYNGGTNRGRGNPKLIGFER